MKQTVFTKQSLTSITIEFFNRVIVRGEVLSLEKQRQIYLLGLKQGYLLPLSVCNTETENWLLENKRNYNTTFYAKWDDVISRNRLELFFDQIQHYASTYGTNFEGEPFLINDQPLDMVFNKYTVIQPISNTEALTRLEKMLQSGIALKGETLEKILYVFDELNYAPDVESIRNKEVKMMLFKQTGILPTEPVEMVRYLVYLATGKTLLISDKQTITTIKYNTPDITDLVNQFGVQKLSSVFLRFKNIFLAFKGNKTNKNVINRLRRAAVVNHQPSKTSFFNQLLGNPTQDNLDKLPSQLQTTNNFTKIKLIQTINVKLLQLTNKFYLVRNQKLWVQTGVNKNINAEYLQKVKAIVYSSLVHSLSSKATTFILPENIKLTLPTSEKSFIGNYPLGTAVFFKTNHNIIGINWRSEQGAQDLDLSLITIDGTKYGWNTAYKNRANSVVYSGDITYAEPEATELMYVQTKFTPSIVNVNLFNGAPNSIFRLFVANEKNIHRNTMVDPDNIVVDVEVQMSSRQKICGVVTGNSLVLADIRTGMKIVSGQDITNLYTDYVCSTLDCYLDLRTVLLDAGFIRKQKGEGEENTLDLTTVNKDSLISLLS